MTSAAVPAVTAHPELHPAGSPVLHPAGSPVPQNPSRAVVISRDAATPYHRLPRTSLGWSWWRMLLALVVTGVGLVVGQLVVMLLGVAVAAATGVAAATPDGLLDWVDGLLTLDAARPLELAVTLASLGVLIPSVYLGLRVLGLRPVGLVASVAYRLRWRWLLRCGYAAVATIVVSLGGGILLGLAVGEPLEPAWTRWPTLVTSVLVILVLVPFQAAAEEYVFRGMFVQAIGSWLPRRRWSLVLVVLVPTALFVAGHVYDAWGLADVGTFALAAMFVTLRTGGLEAAIALHVANNVGVFLLLATGALGSTAQSETGGSLSGVLVTAVTSIAYCWVVEVLARRGGLRRTSPWPEVGSSRALAVPPPLPFAVSGPAAAALVEYPASSRTGSH